MLLRTIQMMIYYEILVSRSIGFFFIFHWNRKVHANLQMLLVCCFGSCGHIGFGRLKRNFRHMSWRRWQHNDWLGWYLCKLYKRKYLDLGVFFEFTSKYFYWYENWNCMRNMDHSSVKVLECCQRFFTDFDISDFAIHQGDIVMGKYKWFINILAEYQTELPSALPI